MHQLTLALLLLAAGAHAAPRAAAMGFTTRGIDAQLGSVYAERFAAALRKHGVSVTTEKDLASVISVERQAQLLGCADTSSSCLAELAGALGAPFIVTGNVSRIGSSVTLSLKILQVAKSQTVYSLSRELSSVEKVLDALEAAAPDAAERLIAVSPEAPAEAVREPARSPSTTPPWVVIALGTAAAGTGAGLLIAAQSFASVIYGDPVMDFGPEAAMQVATRTGPMRTAGLVTLLAGAAVLVAGIVWRVVVASW